MFVHFSTFSGQHEFFAGVSLYHGWLQVTVSKRVLLDVQPPSLMTIRVPPGGALIWGDIDGIFLNVTFLAVRGEFHIGSEDCRFKKRATINLYGKRQT